MSYIEKLLDTTQNKIYSLGTMLIKMSVLCYFGLNNLLQPYNPNNQSHMINSVQR